MAVTKELAALLRDEIDASGSISFARFMERALLEPRLGYYVGERVRAGATGDFMTAPELHPLLAVALAKLAVATWERLGRPSPFRWIEFGAGSGTLLVNALDAMIRERSPLLTALEVQPIEANAYRLAELRARISQLPADVRPAIVAPLAPSETERCDGIVIANEFLDALPVHIVVGRPSAPGGFLERRVAYDATTNTFVWSEGAPDAAVAPAIASRLAAHAAAAQPLIDGQLAEISLAADDWVAALPTRITRGVVVVIDYGHDAATLRDPQTRMAGTALAYAAHRATSDLLGDVGERDLTAHVDLTALRAAAVAAGLSPIASTTQARLLASAGLDAEIERLRGGPEATLEGALALRTALASLMDPRGMGGFAVELFAAGSKSDHAVLSDPRRPLPGAAAPFPRLV